MGRFSRVVLAAGLLLAVARTAQAGWAATTDTDAAGKPACHLASVLGDESALSFDFGAEGFHVRLVNAAFGKLPVGKSYDAVIVVDGEGLAFTPFKAESESGLAAYYLYDATKSLMRKLRRGQELVVQFHKGYLKASLAGIGPAIDRLAPCLEKAAGYNPLAAK